MPGTNLNLSLPSLSDSLATIVSKTSAALQAIENDLAPKVTAGELNINAGLPFNGNAATGLGSIQLVSGNTPTAAGSIYYLNGEFYAIDSTGVIQLTLNGALNASGIGGIVGDYGGVNPARVTYVSASHQYQFTSSPGVWADLAAAHLILEGTNGTVQIGVDNAITTAAQLNFKSFPSSGVSVMVYNAATSTLEDGGVTQATNPFVSTATITGSDVKFSSARQINIPACAATLGITGTNKPVVYPIHLPVGSKITGYGFRVDKASGNTVHLYGVLVRVANDSASTAANADSANAVGPSSAYGIDNVGNSPGMMDMTPTNGANIATIDATHEYYLLITGSDASTPAQQADSYGAVKRWGLNSAVDFVVYAFVSYYRP